jgi:putative transposase
MRKSRFSEEQIIGLLKEAEVGRKVADVCREHGISEPTFYRWMSKYSGLEVNDAKKLRKLEDENRRLKQLVADQQLDNQALKAALGRKW